MKLSYVFIIKVLLSSFLVASTGVLKVLADVEEEILVENLSPLEDGVDKVNLVGEKTPFIIGGETATKGSYPWFSMILREIEGNLYFGCGGTLIAKRYILTAAHCIKDDATYGGVWVGTYSNVQGSQNGGQFSELIRIEKLLRHPSYNEKTFDYDIGLIKLRLPSKITPAQLDTGSASESYESGKKLTAIGFGCTDAKDRKWEQTLREVELSYLNNEECTTFPKSLHPKSSITDNMMCATDAGKSLCSGDSGSALFDEENKIVTGLASWGRLEPFQPTIFPSVFARVSAQFDSWIKPTICNEFTDFDSSKPSFCVTTASPTVSPTVSPTKYITKTPSGRPTRQPTANPTISPTKAPAKAPVPEPAPTKPTKPSTPSGTKTHQPTICEMEYQLALVTDEFGYEISWEIAYYETGEVVAASADSKKYPNSSTISETGCLPFNCYIFTIKDSFGDGLCCGHGNGSYFLFVNDVLMGKGGSFKTREKTLFGTCRAIE